MAKDFLTPSVLGSGAGVSDRAGFRQIPNEYLSEPSTSLVSSNVFPTIWAVGHDFERKLESRDRETIQEWITLFLLHYFGVLHLESFDQHSLENDFGRELWTALSKTYPKSSVIPDKLNLLKADDGAVVAVWYPPTVFFTAKDRGAFSASMGLKAYMTGQRLSFEKCKVFIENAEDRERFHIHLRSLIRLLASKELKDALESFCDEIFGSYEGMLNDLDIDPSNWQTINASVTSPENFLNAYPLRKTKLNGGVVYYLFDDFNIDVQPQWAKSALSSRLPAPISYFQISNSQIGVRFSGSVIQYELGPNDEIVLLKDLFLDRGPFWTKLPKESGEQFVNRLKLIHQVDLQDPSIRSGDKVISLAPIKRSFLENFPEVFDNPKTMQCDPLSDGSIRWTFNLLGRDVVNVSRPTLNTNMSKSEIAIYPPRVARDWKLYLIHGRGKKEISGRWHLIDENGLSGKLVELKDDEYISILQPAFLKTPKFSRLSANRPRAMVIVDDGGQERGIAFLPEFVSTDFDLGQKASLAVDFGTSNTCFAVNAGESSVLAFSLSPEQVWGIMPSLEAPGFVPRKWESEKGFFPTILMSRKSDDLLPTTPPDSLSLEDLFKVDVPCLHKGMGDSVVSDAFETRWRIHENLKWESDARTPWRSLFLQLTLLFAHAEVFFNRKAKIERYVFTYPLAFSDEYGAAYHEKAKEAIKKVREYCYGEASADSAPLKYSKVDESSAVATAVGQPGLKGAMEAFLDIGGGTADIAVRHEGEFLVLDSVKVAGKNFFRFLKKAMDEEDLVGNRQLRGCLRQITGAEREGLLSSDTLPLGTLYSVLVNGFDEKRFKEIEDDFLSSGMGPRSYPRYRARLFFTQLLAYTLIQTASAAISKKIKLVNGINVILGGNAWGLLLFAEWKRSSNIIRREADYIIDTIKKISREGLSPEELECLESLHISSVELLNEAYLNQAKSSVAIGALRALETEHSIANTEPFIGINIKGMKINETAKVDIKWYDRWGRDHLEGYFGKLEEVNRVTIDLPEMLSVPFDRNLAIFTGLGNLSEPGKDNLPGETWQKVNGGIQRALGSIKLVGEKLIVPNPLDEDDRPTSAALNYFMAELLYAGDLQNDLLDDLAKSNRTHYEWQE